MQFQLLIKRKKKGEKIGNATRAKWGILESYY
jgi:hypothetical protein